MSAARRDAEGHRQVGPTRESLVERLIREDMEAGGFDDLPHRGDRLPLEDETLAGDMASAFHILRNAGMAPPWIEADKEVRRLLRERGMILARAPGASTLERSVLRRRLAAVVGDANASIATLNAEAPTLAQHRRPLALDREFAALDAAIDGCQANISGRPAPPASPSGSVAGTAADPPCG